MAAANPNADKILRLMQQGSRALGVRLCFHDRLQRSGLPNAWRIHAMPPCMERKRTDEKRCVAFDGHEVRRALAGNPEGRIQTCPHGFTEIAVPVFSGGQEAGVLFAGPCWLQEGEAPHRQLVRPPSYGWLEDRRIVVKALATELGQLLLGELRRIPADRRRQVLDFLAETVERPVCLADLAEVLRLSASRTGHLVQELFGMPFPVLVQSVKLQEAARLLSTTDHPIGMVAGMTGYEDPNYFARVFGRRFGLSPRAYRRRYPAQA